MFIEQKNNKSKAVPYQPAHMCTTDLHDEIETNIPRDCSSIRNVMNNVKPRWPEGRKLPEEKKKKTQLRNNLSAGYTTAGYKTGKRLPGHIWLRC